MMTRMILGALITLFATVGYAESDLKAVHDEMDRTVWRAFQNAFENMDGEALNLVYADHVLRVTPDGIDTQNQFKQTNKTRFDANIANGDQITLDFWFDSRHTNTTTSYHVGFYRMGVKAPSGKTDYFYGQFHIVLNKINGRWKIVQDWDTASIGGRPITSTDFARQPHRRF